MEYYLDIERVEIKESESKEESLSGLHPLTMNDHMKYKKDYKHTLTLDDNSLSLSGASLFSTYDSSDYSSKPSNKVRAKTYKPIKPTVVMLNNKVIDLKSISTRGVDVLKKAEEEGLLLCPSCKQNIKLIITEDEGAQTRHIRKKGYKVHEAEDILWYESKSIIKNHLQNLFPSASIEDNVNLDNHMADIIIVSSKGGLYSIELQSSNPPKGRIAELQTEYRNQRIKGMWLLDARRLSLPVNHKQLVSVSLKRLEVELLRIGEPLIYFDPEISTIKRVFVPGQLKPILEKNDLASLGKIPSLVKEYTLDSLRIKEGRWHLEDSASIIRTPKPPKLPARLLKLL